MHLIFWYRYLPLLFLCRFRYFFQSPAENTNWSWSCTTKARQAQWSQEVQIFIQEVCMMLRYDVHCLRIRTVITSAAAQESWRILLLMKDVARHSSWRHTNICSTYWFKNHPNMHVNMKTLSQPALLELVPPLVSCWLNILGKSSSKVISCNMSFADRQTPVPYFLLL